MAQLCFQNIDSSHQNIATIFSIEIKVEAEGERNLDRTNVPFWKQETGQITNLILNQ